MVGYTEAHPGDELVSDGVGGEYVVLVVDGAEVAVDHPSGAEVVREPAVVIVPPGTSTIRTSAGGTIIRLLAAPTAPVLAERCANAGDFDEPDGNVAAFAAWPSALGCTAPP